MSQHIVNFNNNVVDATNIDGGFASWNLVPNGPSVSPANQKSPELLLHATTFDGYDSGGNYQAFVAQENVNYTSGELCTLHGQYIKPNDEQVFFRLKHLNIGPTEEGIITITGQDSNKRSHWKLAFRSAPVCPVQA